MTTQAIIQTEGLSKRYGRGANGALALKDLNLAVQPGEVFGYLGPNGAGKTTTIRILLDFIRPTAGRALLFGQDAQANAVALHRRIGYLPSELSLWKHLSGQQVLESVARVRGMRDLGYSRELVERLQLDLKPKVRSYSTGNRRKLGLVLALMHQPELLILDEPTSGLDPLMQQTFNELMLEVKRQGRTVFLSSHMLTEVQAICDRAAILRAGQLTAVESVAALTRVEFRWVTLKLRKPADATVVQQVPGVSQVSNQDGGLRLRLAGDFDPLLQAVQPFYVQDVRVEEPSLEEIFLSYYGNGSSAQAQAASHKGV